MPNIFYYTDSKGRLCANWPGISKRVPVEKPDGSIKKESRKTGQCRLGFVVDKENHLFYREDEGFYQFNPDDQSRSIVPPDELPSWIDEMVLRRKRPPVIVDFGGSYFLDTLIKGIGYGDILDSIAYYNRDRLYTMLHYYVLSGKAGYLAEDWYQHNFTKFLYPKANPSSQRISDFLEAIGSEENRRDFLLAHIPYLLKSTNKELCILIDSTGMPNKCDLPYTRVNVHEGAVNIEFRVVIVVQKSTGLPVYYEMIPGSIPDVSKIQEIFRKLKNMGYTVQYSLGDAAYSCPAVLERMVLSGIDFMTRLNPTYETYKKAVEEHLDELELKGRSILFKTRQVKILKVTSVIATEKETNDEVIGYVYLCRDINSWHGKSNHLLNTKKVKKLTSDERDEECNRFGLFALVSTIDLAEEEVLKEYYMRQAVEYFIDYSKNYANLMPVRNHKEETVKGHLLLSFIATFLVVLIKNKLNILDSPYARIPLTLEDELEEECISIDNGDGTDIELLVEQEISKEIFKSSPSALFGELQFQKADVYNKEIVPSAPTAQANEFYKAYHLVSPLAVLWDQETLKITYEFREHEENKCTRRLAFFRRPTKTDEDILASREKSAKRKIEKLKEEHGNLFHEQDSQKTEDEKKPTSSSVVVTETKRGRGRPAGSKNKKTLEREAEFARTHGEAYVPVKRGRGRPPGSKNKKTPAQKAIV